MTFSAPDLVITLAYFSIPVQILVALCKFPRLTRRATKRVVILLVLFALFISLCGAGHLIRCIGFADTVVFRVVNVLTAAVSLLTSVYLLPFVPNLLEGTDRLYLEATASKKIMEAMYPATVRERLMLLQGDDDDASRRTPQGQGDGGGVPPEGIDGDGGGGDEEDGKSGDAREARNNGDALRRMARSESMTARTYSRAALRIQDFIQQRRRNSTVQAARDQEPAEPIADTFPSTSIMFADIANFTLWCSEHSPEQVFTLLEALFFEFDQVASRMGVFKLSTVGDCYIAATGVPYPRDDHAVVLARFAECCRMRANEVFGRLSGREGMEDVIALSIRIGIHSGPVTAGVLRGQKARFDLFGDTINTAQRVESTGLPDRIHLSRETAELLEGAGRGGWLVPREECVSAKGKGELKTFWLGPTTADDGEGCCSPRAASSGAANAARGGNSEGKNDPAMRAIAEEDILVPRECSACVAKRDSDVVV